MKGTGPRITNSALARILDKADSSRPRDGMYEHVGAAKRFCFFDSRVAGIDRKDRVPSRRYTPVRFDRKNATFLNVTSFKNGVT